jgi:hypothetical protein
MIDAVAIEWLLKFLLMTGVYACYVFLFGMLITMFLSSIGMIEWDEQHIARMAKFSLKITPLAHLAYWLL